MKRNFYSKLLFTIAVSTLSFFAKGQINITNNDTAICEGQQFTIHADLVGRTPVNIPFQNNNTYSSVINLGFTFNFYGTPYTQCVVGSNGLISFNLANANQPMDNVVDQPVPGETSTLNSIMCPYVALNIVQGGTIDYAVMGTAPNRQFIVTWCSVPMFSCNNLNVAFQAVLYETTNVIDLHMIRNPGPQCVTFNFGRSIQGVQDATGTFATTVPLRNFPQAWVGDHDSHRFTPVGSTNYTVAAIPHTHIPDGTGTIRWYSGGFQVGTGPNFNYSYVTSQSIIARVANCPDTTADTIDVIVNQVYQIVSVDSTNPSQCEAADGTITLLGFFPGLTYTIHYTDVLGNPQTVVDVADNAGGLLITGLVDGNYTNFYVVSAQGCTSSVYTPIPLYDQSVFIDTVVAVFPILCNASDGSLSLQGLVPGVTYTVSYVYNSTTYTVTATADGSGNVLVPNLAAGTYTNITAATQFCNSNVMGPVTLIDPQPVISNFTGNNPTLCRAMNGFIVLEGLLPDSNYVAEYTVGGIVYSVALVANGNGEVVIQNLGAGVYTNITVQLLTCKSDPVGPVTLVNPPITADFTFNLLPGCTEDIVEFTDISAGSAYPFRYKWTFADGTTDSVQNPVHTYLDQGTYTVKLWITDSVCKDSITHDVVIDHPLVANFTVDFDTICQNGAINVTDASIGSQPVSYYWDFANGDINSASVATATSTYTRPGMYHVMEIITDFIGCKDTAFKWVRVDSLTEIGITFNSDKLCAGEELQIDATYADTGSTGINWDFGDAIITTTYGHSIDHSYESPGTYSVHIIATGRVCADVDSVRMIQVFPQPSINIGPDTSICPASEALALQDFINAGNSGATWRWMYGDAIMEETSFNIVVQQPGRYAARVTIDGCSATDSVVVAKDCYLDIPNVFTPDGDNNNDYFIPRQWLSKGVSKYKMQVFNRWGQEIYVTTDPGGRGWDGNFNGQAQPQGVYVYLIEVTFRDGVQEKKQGNITLLR